MNDLLQPGKYSIFVLLEDGMWKQPTYRVTHAISEDDAPNEYVEILR